MWRILKFEPGPLQGTQAEQLVGILLVYVDDLLLLGDEPTIQATIQAIQAKWETSIPEKIDKFSGVRFLGAELYNDGPKWWMTQRNYIQDLLARNLGGDRESWPTRKIPMLAEPDTREDPPGKDAINVKEAQRIIGELVWISTRTRPDLSFAINRLASLITKDPQLVIELSKNIWYYLAATIDHGLQFENQEDEKIMNIYTDASFNDVSTGCHLVMWGLVTFALEKWKAVCFDCLNGRSRIGGDPGGCPFGRCSESRPRGGLRSSSSSRVSYRQYSINLHCHGRQWIVANKTLEKEGTHLEDQGDPRRLASPTSCRS